MKKNVIEFFKRGMCFMGFGPIILVIIWGILGVCNVIESLSVSTVVFGILTVSFMAFVAAGVTVVYQIERLPLLYATLIHGIVLYLDYAIIYLLNGWIKDGATPFVIFTIIFVIGYGLIWGIVYLFIRKDVEKMNRKVKKG